MKNKDIIICHYNKNLDWVNSITNSNIYVYYKGEKPEVPESVVLTKSENVGREPETFIRHIVNNYNNLNDQLYFLQDNPFDHYLDTSLIEKDITSFTWLGYNIHECDLDGKPHSPWKLPIKDILDDLKLSHSPTVQFLPGSQFAVNRETILKRPLNFYKKCHSILLEGCPNKDGPWILTDRYSGVINTASPWVFERIWGYIFNV